MRSSVSAFEAAIQLPVANWLSANDAQDRIHYIVLTRGIPLSIVRVVGTIRHRGQRRLGIERPLPAHDRGAGPRPRRVPRTHISSGDQPVAEALPFSHERIPLYLVTRLDGYTVDDVLKLIDHGQPSRD